jgi:hypothetical protein
MQASDMFSFDYFFLLAIIVKNLNHAVEVKI